MGRGIPAGSAPARWIGKLSYSIYLWHWPILIIAADAAGTSSLPFRRNVVWLLVALGAAMASFYLVESPVRRASLGRSSRTRGWAPVGLGVLLIGVSLGVATLQLNSHSRSPATSSGQGKPFNAEDLPAAAASVSAVKNQVKRSTTITSLPTSLTPPLADVSLDWGGPEPPCWPATAQTSIPACMFGDPHGTHTMVLYGDSHAGMWFDAMNRIATNSRWKLAYLGKGWCPANMLPYGNPPGVGAPHGEYAQCDQWHQFALQRMRQLHPDLVVVTQEIAQAPNGYAYSARQWEQAMATTIKRIPVPASRVLVLGNIPSFRVSPPLCLSRNPRNVQACSSPLPPFMADYNAAERRAAAKTGARYVSVIPWFCSATCTAVVGHYEVYFDDYHMTLAYSAYLAGVLDQAIDLPRYR